MDRRLAKFRDPRDRPHRAALPPDLITDRRSGREAEDVLEIPIREPNHEGLRAREREMPNRCIAKLLSPQRLHQALAHAPAPLVPAHEHASAQVVGADRRGHEGPPRGRRSSTRALSFRRGSRSRACRRRRRSQPHEAGARARAPRHLETKDGMFRIVDVIVSLPPRLPRSPHSARSVRSGSTSPLADISMLWETPKNPGRFLFHARL